MNCDFNLNDTTVLAEGTSVLQSPLLTRVLVLTHREVLTALTVALGCPTSKFSGAIDPATAKITVGGTVRGGAPFVNKIGAFDVDISLEVHRRRLKHR